MAARFVTEAAWVKAAFSNNDEAIMIELSFPRDTISAGALDLYKGRAAELIGYKDRMDEPRHKMRVSDTDAVPIQGPRGGIPRYTTVCFRDDVCEDGDAEDTLIARIDARTMPLDDEDVLFIEEEDDEGEDWPLFVTGVPLDAYLADYDDDGEPLPAMTEDEEEYFAVIATCIDLDTARAARREGNLLPLVLVLDRVTQPTPAPVAPATPRATRTGDDDQPRFGTAFETAPGLEFDLTVDLEPYERLAFAVSEEKDPSFFPPYES